MAARSHDLSPAGAARRYKLGWCSWEVVELFLSAWAIAEDFVFVVPIVELCSFAEGE